MPPRKPPEYVIDIALEEPSRSSPALGQVDKLLKQSFLETQSLQVVRRMMLRDMLDRAKVTGIEKLNAAAKHREQLLLPEEANGNGAAPSRKRKKFRDGRQPPEMRIETLRNYLQQRPAGQDTLTIAKGIGWRPNQVLKFVKRIAIGEKAGYKEPIRWTLRKGAARSGPKKIKRGIVKPREQRQQEIRGYLSQHPEAYTSQVAKALHFKPNSHFVKIMRTVARPLRPTTATEPIQWVLAD